MERLNRLYKRLLVLGPILIIILIFVQIMYITRFNEYVYSVEGSDISQKTYLSMDPRDDSTSTWLKRDFKWKGNTFDLKAQTIDGNLLNNSNDTINSWSIKIDIHDNCFINNAWCGKVEIHQYVGSSDEATQTLDLRDYDIEKVKLDHVYDGDLLIPLKEGDYVIYRPSTKAKEVPVARKSQLTMGFIFYYFDDLDFLTHRLDFTYHRSMTYGKLYVLILALSLFWIIGVVVFLFSMQIYKDAQKQLEMKKSGLLCMSDIYYAIYIVEMDKDLLIPVVDRELEGIKRPRNLGASEQINRLVDISAEEAYRQITLDFCDLSTLPERMKDKDSIACEYISRHFGWCSIRFFAMDRIEDRSLDRVLLTIQIIDSEKREMDMVEQQILAAENEHRERGAFLEVISDELLMPVSEVRDHNSSILSDCSDEGILAHAAAIERAGARLDTLIGELVDYSKLEAGRITINNTPFFVATLVENVQNKYEAASKEQGIDIITDISDKVPDSLNGDAARLARILDILMANALWHTKEGSITIGVYGSPNETGTHVVFSIKDTGDGTNDRDRQEVGIKLAAALVEYMGSRLNMVSVPGDGNNSYFELDLEGR